MFLEFFLTIKPQAGTRPNEASAVTPMFPVPNSDGIIKRAFAKECENRPASVAELQLQRHTGP